MSDRCRIFNLNSIGINISILDCSQSLFYINDS